MHINLDTNYAATLCISRELNLGHAGSMLTAVCIAKQLEHNMYLTFSQK